MVKIFAQHLSLVPGPAFLRRFAGKTWHHGFRGAGTFQLFSVAANKFLVNNLAGAGHSATQPPLAFKFRRALIEVGVTFKLVWGKEVTYSNSV